MSQNLYFKQLFDEQSSTYTYLLADLSLGHAIIIDPVYEQAYRDISLIKSLGLDLKYCIETHIHADHVTSAHLLMETFACKKVVPEQCGALYADVEIKHGQKLSVGCLTLEAIHTPGHTSHHMSYLCGSMIFTGDALLINGCGRCDFQGGDAQVLYDSVLERLFTLPLETTVYPAHDYKGLTSSTIGKQKEHNPRFKDKSKAEFKQLMAELDLSYPKQMIQAVPKNLMNANMDPLIDALKVLTKPSFKILNIGTNLPYTTIELAKELKYDLWQIIVPVPYHDDMLDLVKDSMVPLEPIKTYEPIGHVFGSLTMTYDLVIVESLFDQIIESDLQSIVISLSKTLHAEGRFCLYSQFQDKSFDTHEDINRCLAAINGQFSLRTFEKIDSMISPCFLLESNLSLEAGFYLTTWVKR